MELLEREAELGALDEALADARRGSGSVFVISGEAGIGKTRLVQAFADAHEGDARILWGACDDLSTPRTLGPFHDIGLQVGGDFEAAVSDGERGRVFDRALELVMDHPRPTVLIIEDVHWADGATLDVLKFLGRRMGRASASLILTYRSEEVPPDHPLRLVVGDLPGDVVRRLPLAPLSEPAVRRLAAEYQGSASRLFTETRGNPFLVTEALLAEAGEVPANVRDAVRSRVARLSANGRAVAQLISVVPSQTERALLATLPGYRAEALEECRYRGLVEYDSGAAWYRHELVRGAVEGSLTAERRRELNGLVWSALAGRNADEARIVHHARKAGAADAVARYAPVAGRRASSASAHREAVAHYRAAVYEGTPLDAESQAELLTDYAVECYYTNDAAEGLNAAERALAIWRELGVTRREGDTLRWLSRFHWWLGHGERAVECGRQAIEVLSTVAESRELAMAYSNLAQVFMLAQRSDEAEAWATKAIAVAREVDDRSTLAHALNNLGSTRLRIGDVTGWALLEESLAIASAEGFDDHAGRAYSNLGWTALDYRDYERAERIIEEGLEYAWRRELAGSLYYLTAERARLNLDQGRWDQAEADARWVLGRPEEPGITNMPALATLARLQVRRGDVEANATLEAAWSLAQPTGELQRIAPVAAARAEFAWLNDDRDAAVAAAAEAYEHAVEARQPWIADELAFWLWRAGLDVEAPSGSDTPFARQMEGAWNEAAEGWARIGCPYERALAVMDGDEPTRLLEALGWLDELGAVPAAARLRRRLRALEVPHVPRGPRRETRAHPAGLTPRQVEVLKLVADDLTNAEIADRLFISSKTVDHHVSAILTKLEVSSRGKAVAAAQARGLI